MPLFLSWFVLSKVCFALKFHFQFRLKDPVYFDNVYKRLSDLTLPFGIIPEL